jgi:hypothetical protein
MLLYIPSSPHRSISEFLFLFGALNMTCVSLTLKGSLEAARWEDGVTGFSLNKPHVNDAYVTAAASRFKRLFLFFLLFFLLPLLLLLLSFD